MLPAKDPLLIRAMGNKAGALLQLGRLFESLALFQAALMLGRRVFKEDSLHLLVIEENTASTLSQLGRREEAAAMYERQIEVRERSPIFGPSHESTWLARSNLGTVFFAMRKLSEAIPLLRDSLSFCDGLGLGPDHPRLGIIPQQLGRALLGAGLPAQAVPMFQRSIAFTERKHGLFHYESPPTSSSSLKLSAKWEAAWRAPPPPGPRRRHPRAVGGEGQGPRCWSAGARS